MEANKVYGVLAFIIVTLIYYFYTVSDGKMFTWSALNTKLQDRIYTSIKSTLNALSNQESVMIVGNPMQQHRNIVCFVPSTPKRKNRARSVKNTWGKRCDTLLFFSIAEDKELGTIKVPVIKEDPMFLWMKTTEGLKYIFKNHIHQADWILKADDDTYVIIEHLREFLMDYSPNDDHFFGSIFQDIHHDRNHNPVYITGGAGYILSNSAMKKFALEALSGNRKKCPFPPDPSKLKKTIAMKSFKNRGEDVELSYCLRALKINPEDTLDKKGRGRFYQFPLAFHLNPYPYKSSRSFYEKLAVHILPPGLASTSDTLIGFHRVGPEEMYAVDFLLYHSKPVQNMSQWSSSKNMSKL